MKTKNKPNIYIGPNAPTYLRDMLEEIFPDAKAVSGEEMDKKISEAIAEEDTEREHPIYYQNLWMWKNGIRPIPLWLVGWFVIPLEKYRAWRQRRRDAEWLP